MGGEFLKTPVKSCSSLNFLCLTAAGVCGDYVWHGCAYIEVLCMEYNS